MLRSVKVKADDLDAKLVELQERGHHISQTIPCPGSFVDKDTTHCVVEMEIIVVYMEPAGPVQ